MKERLKVEHLSVSFFTDEGEVQAVRDVSFSLNAGEVLAVVGESGCGKSVLCKSIMKLLPENAKIEEGRASYSRFFTRASMFCRVISGPGSLNSVTKPFFVISTTLMLVRVSPSI